MNIDSIKSDKVLDTRGLHYPMQLRKLKKALNDMENGKILEIWDSDPASKKDIPDFLTSGDDQLIGIDDDPSGYTRYFIKKHEQKIICK